MTTKSFLPHPHTPRNVNRIHQTESQGINSKLAVLITKGFGSMYAFYVLIAWMLIWMTLASVNFWLFALDKYPFAFLLFLSNLVQLWALPVLAVGQNVLNRKQELQAEETFNTTVKSYHDIEQVMLHLDHQDIQMELLAKQLAVILERLPARRA